MSSDTGRVATPGRFQCQVCHQTFGRVEHLNRHSRSHSKERYLKCASCSKGFYRSDALRRHEEVHTQTKRSSLGRGIRACFACAKARRKCSGDSPCSACHKRSTYCKYPTSTHPTENLDVDLVSSSNVEPLPTPDRQDANTPISQTAGCRDYPQLESEILQQYHATDRNVMTGVEVDASGFQTNPEDSQAPSLSAPLERAREANNWPPSNVSSINWLPDDWIPDFQFEPGQSSSLGEYPALSQSTQGALLGFTSIRNGNFSQPSGSLSDFNSEHEVASPGTTDTSSAGYYYVDGDGARLPRVRKELHRTAHHSSDPYTPLSGTNDSDQTHLTFGFPAAASEFYEDLKLSSFKFQKIHVEVYSEISRIYVLTCVTSTFFSPFRAGDFPSLETISYFVDLYFENFQPILPFIHQPTFNLSRSHWLIILAIAAMGSHFAGFEDNEVFVVAMHEFLRRAISTVDELDARLAPDWLVLVQARLLSSIGMMYSGDPCLADRAQSSMGDISKFCSTEWQDNIRDFSDVDGDDSSQMAWETWIQAESRRRTGYSIWLLDCMSSFQFQQRSLLSLSDAKVPVPCQEVLWEAETSLDWYQLYSCSTESPSLHEVVQVLYVGKRLQSSMGEFSRILCIHALFRQTWEVEAYFQQPLTSRWNPVAEKQDITLEETSTKVWLPSIQTYTRWRNSACDCLDILHWHANSVIGAASGMEHPTVLHLHLARVVLLTPFRQIVQLAGLLTSGREPKDEIKIAEVRKQVRKWALEDQHKARLAMIHAGVLFWHVRRYSTDAFYEPSSVFLATLALWAYGTFAQSTSGPSADGQSPQGEDDAESPFPTSMQLDRPADDELVQLFVKRGGVMRANITGVGNLCSAKGPGRVLLEGKKLLMDLKCWGYRRKAIRTLAILAGVCNR